MIGNYLLEKILKYAWCLSDEIKDRDPAPKNLKSRA